MRIHRILAAAALTIAATGAQAQAMAMLEDTTTASGPRDEHLAVSPALSLAPGEYRLWPERAASGEAVITISLANQTLHVYRGDTLMGVSTISSGRPGYETPRGVFTILQKRKRHFSNLYDNAPMPYMQRLTWGGIAMHGGQLPGYPASHGCIRLPKAFARSLYGLTGIDTTVIVAREMETALATAERYGMIGDAPPPEPAVRDALGTLAAGASTDDLNRAMLLRLSEGRR